MAEIQCMNLFLHYVGNEHASFQDFSSYSRFKGEDIILQKQIKQGFTFNIAFQKNHIVRVYMECPKEQDCFVLQSNMSLQSKVEKNRLYLDIDDTDNLNPKFTYYLLKDYLTSVSSEIYQIYKLAESSTNY